MEKYDALKLEKQLCFPLYAVSKEIVKKEVSTPEWFDKEIKKEELTDEQRELAERLRRGNN